MYRGHSNHPGTTLGSIVEAFAPQRKPGKISFSTAKFKTCCHFPAGINVFCKLRRRSVLLLGSWWADHMFGTRRVKRAVKEGGRKDRGGTASAYTRAALSPEKALIAVGLGLAVFAAIRSLAGSDD